MEEKLDELRGLLGKADGDPLRIVGVGAGAWGSVFATLLQDNYGHFREKVQIGYGEGQGELLIEPQQNISSK